MTSVSPHLEEGPPCRATEWNVRKRQMSARRVIPIRIREAMAESGMVINDIVRRFRWAMQRHGIIGMLSLGAEHISSIANRWRPSVRAEMQDRKRREKEFDEEFCVDTGGFIHPTKLNIESTNLVHAVAYGGSDPRSFRTTIAALPIDYRQFTFVDFGSGKGRAILLATEFLFKKIVGIEFSRELHAIAQENIRRFNRDRSKCNAVESVCMDAVDFPLPDDCLVCYFCNPFDGTIMGKVLANIADSLLGKPRDLFIVYYNAKAGHLVDQMDCFSKIWESGTINIWRSRSEQGRIE